MRKQNKEIKDKETVIGLLHISPVGRLGTIGSDEYPLPIDRKQGSRHR